MTQCQIAAQERTLVFFVRNGKVMLGKAPENETAERLTGIESACESGEHFTACALRKADEHLGGILVNPRRLSFAGMLFVRCETEDLEAVIAEIWVFLFDVTGWPGFLKETREFGNFAWYPFKNLPEEAMPPDHRHWLCDLLSGKNLVAFLDYQDIDRRILKGVSMATMPEGLLKISIASP